MSVFNADLTIDQGADFSYTTLAWVIAGAIQNLTGYTAKLMIRATPADVAPILSITSTPNGNGSVVTPNGAAGTATVTIAHADTSSLPYAPGPLLYDLDVISGTGVVTRLSHGRVFVNAAIDH